MENSAVSLVKQNLLDRTIQVKIKDGRIFTGTFKCLDYQMNVLLVDCHQQAVVKQISSDIPITLSSQIGIVNIPGSEIEQVVLCK
jgi:small nuclear ribonucleoprotein (snRNP)-like protein